MWDVYDSDPPPTDEELLTELLMLAKQRLANYPGALARFKRELAIDILGPILTYGFLAARFLVELKLQNIAHPLCFPKSRQRLILGWIDGWARNYLKPVAPINIMTPVDPVDVVADLPGKQEHAPSEAKHAVNAGQLIDTKGIKEAFHEVFTTKWDSPPGWLKVARKDPGGRGRGQAQWDLLEAALLILDRNKIPPYKMDAAVRLGIKIMQGDSSVFERWLKITDVYRRQNPR